MTVNRSLFSSKRQDWGTPDAYFTKLHALCKFTTDACAFEHNAKLPRFIPPDGDGLNFSWDGQRVFYNPEYRACNQWVPKARNEAISGRGFSVGLVPYRPDPEWWAVGALSEDGAAGSLRSSHYDPENRVLWLRWQWLITGIHSVPDRLPFKSPTGTKATVAPFPSAVIFHFNPLTRPPARRWLLEGMPR